MFDEDDFMHENRDVVTTPWGAALLPKSVKNMRGDRLEAFVELQQLAVKMSELESQLWVHSIPHARAQGLSWSVIGAAVGMTGEGVAKRAERELS